MATYMIDYENVKTGGLNGISRLTAEDRVIIFYSENANRLTFDLHRRLMECPAKIEYREVTVGGHNALDFQLVTYLGYLIAQNPTGQYLIISYDRGFEYVVNFWRKDGLCIGLLPYLKDPSYALSKVVRGEICKDEPKDEAGEETAEETVPEPAEEPVVEFVSAEEEAPAEEVIPEEASVAEAPAEVALAAEAPVEAPAEEAPAEVPAEEPKKNVKKAPAKKKSSSKKPKVELKAVQPEDQPKEEPKEEPKAEPKAEPKKEEPKKEKSARVLPSVEELRALLGDLVADDPEARFVRSSLEKYKTKLGLNNALVKSFGNQRAGEIYQKVKPFVAEKKK